LFDGKSNAFRCTLPCSADVIIAEAIRKPEKIFRQLRWQYRSDERNTKTAAVSVLLRFLFELSVFGSGLLGEFMKSILLCCFMSQDFFRFIPSTVINILLLYVQSLPSF
jgi:hypothetical protein